METKKPYERVKRDQTRQGLMDAYEAWVRNEPGSGDNLLIKVRELAITKTRHLDFDFDFETANNIDDRAQQITIKVANNLSSFVGTGASFYAYVHRICFTHAADVANELMAEKAAYGGTPTILRRDTENQNNDDERVDNPAIYSSEVRDFFITIPREVQGIDRDICLLILAGKNNAQIAAELEISEQAVKDRCYKMRRTHRVDKNKWKLDRAAQEAERDGLRARLDAFREQQNAAMSASLNVDQSVVEG